jgi:hypothetical protein
MLKTAADNKRNQGQIYSCGGPGAIEMNRPLTVTTNLGYGHSFFFIITKNANHLIVILEKPSVSVKLVHSIAVL